jgi:heme A synthase
MLWWMLLAFISGHFRDRFNDRAVVWLNRIAAGAIGAFGLITMGLAFKK